MKQPELVPATQEHFTALGENLKYGGRAIAAVLDGRTIGVAGFYLERGRMVLFSTITPGLRPFKKTIVRGAIMVMKSALKIRAPIHALCDKNAPGAERLLRALGFERLEGDIFERLPWHTRAH